MKHFIYMLFFLSCIVSFAQQKELEIVMADPIKAHLEEVPTSGQVVVTPAENSKSTESIPLKVISLPATLSLSPTEEANDVKVVVEKSTFQNNSQPLKTETMQATLTTEPQNGVITVTPATKEN